MEALVALVILAAVFGVFSQWLISVQEASEKVQQVMLLEEAHYQAFHNIQQQNLSVNPSGSFDLKPFRVEWNAELLKQSKDEEFRRQPLWNVALYSVSITFILDAKQVHVTNTKIYAQQAEPNIDIEAPNAL